MQVEISWRGRLVRSIDRHTLKRGWNRISGNRSQNRTSTDNDRYPFFPSSYSLTKIINNTTSKRRDPPR